MAEPVLPLYHGHWVDPMTVRAVNELMAHVKWLEKLIEYNARMGYFVVPKELARPLDAPPLL